MTFFKSPLVLMILLGSVLFVGYYILSNGTRSTIVINTDIVRKQIQHHESLTGVQLEEDEIRSLIENYVSEEILIREAGRLGYVQNDGRVRRRLLEIMQSVLSEDFAEPGYQQLKDYYDENLDLYMVDSSRSFTHVFYRDSVPDLELFHSIIETSDSSRAGDYFPAGHMFTGMTRKYAIQNFGSPLTNNLFSIPLNSWSGPYTSVLGQHFLYVFDEQPSYTPSFEEIEDYLISDYYLARSQRIREAKIEELKGRYEIIHDWEISDFSQDN